MAVPSNEAFSDYCYASFTPRPLVLDDDDYQLETCLNSVKRENLSNRKQTETYEECRPDADELPSFSTRKSDIYEMPIDLQGTKVIPEYAVVNKNRDLYDAVADPAENTVSADGLYAIVDKSKKHRERFANSESPITNGNVNAERAQSSASSDSSIYRKKSVLDDLYEDPDALRNENEAGDEKGANTRFPDSQEKQMVENMRVLNVEAPEPEEGKLSSQPSRQRSYKNSKTGNGFNVETAQEKGYAFHNGIGLLDVSHEIRRERSSKKKKGGKSQFFVAIPEKRGDTPPPKPKPFSSEGRLNLSRKFSLPVTSLQTQEDDYSEIGAMRERLNSNGRQALSLEDLLGNYVEVRDGYSNAKASDADAKSHRRNHSHNGFNLKRNSVDISCLNSSTAVNGQGFNEFKKQHRRMRSHENVSKIFANTPQGSQNDIENTERDNSPQSGKASVESSVSSESSMSVPSKSSRGSVDSADSTDMDMRQLLQQAEELVSEELPEGWQEVRDGNETYYWHIWTGTIQYERPMLSTSSSSRSVSPMSSQDSCQSINTSASDLRGLQSKSPQPLSRPESPPNNIKQAISFPVHSMGWMEVEEDRMASSILGDTVNHCITTLAAQRNDLWHTSDTWGEGRDIKLILEGEVLKLFEPREKVILLNQPIAKMRVWGVGKEDQRDFAYIARDPKTGKHKCHMFRCHGSVSGRSITNALHSICNRVLEEKRKAKERASPSVKTGSDLLHAPVPQTAKDSSGFNEKPFIEQKKSFTAKYVGCTEVAKPSGIEVLNKAVTKLTTGVTSSSWRSVLVDITTSEIRTIDCTNQAILMEDRVRFISFLGIARDEKMCGYIVAVGQDTFICHVFMCAPDAGILTKAIEEACRLRYEKVLDRHALDARRVSDGQVHPTNHQKSIMKEKGLAFKSSMQELFHKFQKKDGKRRTSKQDEGSQTSPENKSPPLQPGANEYMIKYFGCVQVTIGTGIETVQTSVEQLSGGSMMVGYLEVTMDTLTLYDSQRTNLSRRVIDLDKVSFCGMTGDSKHFGIIVTQGRGKYVCHVFQEYKTPVDQIVKVINEVK